MKNFESGLSEGRKGAFVELPTWRTPDPGAIPVLQVGNGGWLGTPDLGFRSRPSDCPRPGASSGGDGVSICLEKFAISFGFYLYVLPSTNW